MTNKNGHFEATSTWLTLDIYKPQNFWQIFMWWSQKTKPTPSGILHTKDGDFVGSFELTMAHLSGLQAGSVSKPMESPSVHIKIAGIKWMWITPIQNGIFVGIDPYPAFETYDLHWSPSFNSFFYT